METMERRVTVVLQLTRKSSDSEGRYNKVQSDPCILIPDVLGMCCFSQVVSIHLVFSLGNYFQLRDHVLQLEMISPSKPHMNAPKAMKSITFLWLE